MKVSLGVLGFSPEVFWKMTMNEFLLACEGRIEANGGGDNKALTDPLSMQELEELMIRFPDGHRTRKNRIKNRS